MSEESENSKSLYIICIESIDATLPVETTRIGSANPLDRDRMVFSRTMLGDESLNLELTGFPGSVQVCDLATLFHSSDATCYKVSSHAYGRYFISARL